MRCRNIRKPQNNVGHLCSPGRERWAGFSEESFMACLDQNSLLRDEGRSLLGALRCWRGASPPPPGSEEGKTQNIAAILQCLGSPHGAQLCPSLPSTHTPVFCYSLDKLFFSISGQVVLSTDLSPRLGQAELPVPLATGIGPGMVM